MILCADKVITGDGKTVIDRGGVLVRGKKIEVVKEADSLKQEYPGEEVKVYDGCTLLPGLIDLHVHIGYYYGEEASGEYEKNLMLRAYYAGKRMEDTLRSGVTTVRDLSSADGIANTLKRAAQMGLVRSPRIFTSLKGLCMTGGHGAEMTGAVIEVDGTLEAKKAVRENLKNGADCLKLLTSEGYRGEEFSQEELDAIVTEAHRFGKTVAAHAGYGRSIPMCIKAGCDTIEHGTHLTVPQAEEMKKNHQTWVPTMYAFHYVNDLIGEGLCGDELFQENQEYIRNAVDAYKKHFKELYDTGVRVAAGTDTDALNHPEASPVARECEYMVRYGLSPVQAVGCATGNAGEVLSAEIGRLKEGYMADLLVVKGDVSKDISALLSPQAVYQEGTRI